MVEVSLFLYELAYFKINVMTREAILLEVPQDFCGANNSVYLLIFLVSGSFSECSLSLVTRTVERNCNTGRNEN